MPSPQRAPALANYIRSGHQAVKGWLSPIAVHAVVTLANAQRQLGISGPVCEIGVHHGRFFILLHLLTDATELSVAYDLFERQNENRDQSGAGDRRSLVTNLARHHCDVTRIKVLTRNSLELRASDVLAATGGQVRMISIDGGHTAETTASDLTLAAAVVGDGGLVILDDVFNPSWPGVAEGAFRALAGGASHLVPVTIAGNKLVLTTSVARAEAYLSALSAAGQDFLQKRSRLRDHEVLILSRHDRSWSGRLASTPLWRWLKRRPVGRRLRQRFGNGAPG